MINNMTIQAEHSLQRYFLRRQFIVGPEPYIRNEYWYSRPLMHGQHISIHKDLSFVKKENSDILISIIGIAIDPYRPEIGEYTIVEELLEEVSDIESLIEATKVLSGRWVIIFQDTENTYVFTDPTGHRTVYYYERGDNFWFGSQPEIINQAIHLNLRKDRVLIDFLRSERFRKLESAWVGNKTIYEDCFILIPNHYVQFSPARAVRFFPAGGLKKDGSKEENLREVIVILEGTMQAIANRYDVMQSITAGYDSRVLLAASKEVKDQIDLFVERNGLLPTNHPDVRIPQQMCTQLNLSLKIINSAGKLPGWFTFLLSRNVTNARVLTSTNSIFHKLYSDSEAIYIGGNIGELLRNPFGKFFNGEDDIKKAEELATILGYNNEPYVVRELKEWTDELDRGISHDIGMGEMLYWEQRLSNWGAQYPAEQDIAAEELRPFNNRILIERVLSIKKDDRAESGSALFRELINGMWPELLAFPFNPTHNSLANRIKKIVPRFVIERIKRAI